MERETSYARSGDVNIAYQVVGTGPIDLVFVMGWVSHLDYFWAEPSFARFLNHLASFSRLILFDKRGTGLSDRITTLPTLEQRMDDVRAVMDAVGSKQAALLGLSEGGPMCALFAATYPERTHALIMIGSYARRIQCDDYPWGPTKDEHEHFLKQIATNWGGPVGIESRAPSLANDEQFCEWWATYLRMSASPGAALAFTKMNAEIDVRPILPTIQVPTLIIHRTGDQALRVEGSKYMAQVIPNAKFVELPGSDHLPFVGGSNDILDEIEEFLTGSRHIHDAGRALATLMFSDIVGSTALAARIGDEKWRILREQYYAVVRKELVRWRGIEVDTAGDGVLATFDGPARGIRCGCAIRNQVRRLGFDVRVGLHTVECDLTAGKVSGIAVHIGARVADLAQPGEVLVSSTVRDLVAGSGIRFLDRGMQALKGLPEEWRLYLVEEAGPPPLTEEPRA